MFLSIIIPIYKVESYLRECLDSIAASPLDCWEAILVDDGSPDGCPQICDEYAARDERFRVIHQRNAGVAAARNAGLDVAQGEWIWFVDSDDVVNMQPVEGMMDWLKANKNGTAELYKNEDKKVNVPVGVPVNTPVDLVLFDLDTFRDGEPIAFDAGTTVPMVRDEMLDKNEFLLRHVCYHHPRLWYRRGLVNHHQRPIRFSLGIRVAEDLEFQYKYLTRCQHPVKVDATLYYYRLRGSSATGDAAYRAKAVEDLPVVLKNLATWTKENDVKLEPWYDYRILKLLQNLLYSASLVQNLNTKVFQKTIREIVAEYKRQQFPFVKNPKIRLATWSVKSYFLFNRIYLKLKGIQS